jgi:hypothetical protein
MSGERTDHDLLIEMNTKLDVALGQIKDHEGRMRKVEFKLWSLSGLAALLGAGIGSGLTGIIGH